LVDLLDFEIEGFAEVIEKHGFSASIATGYHGESSVFEEEKEFIEGFFSELVEIRWGSGFEKRDACKPE